MRACYKYFAPLALKPFRIALCVSLVCRAKFPARERKELKNDSASSADLLNQQSCHLDLPINGF